LTIATWPLQVYPSAVIFSPRTSLIAATDRDELPTWLKQTPRMGNSWNDLLRIFQGCTGTAAFLPDGTKIVSPAAGYKRAGIRLWDINGKPQDTFLSDSHAIIKTVTVSKDGK